MGHEGCLKSPAHRDFQGDNSRAGAYAFFAMYTAEFVLPGLLEFAARSVPMEEMKDTFVHGDTGCGYP